MKYTLVDLHSKPFVARNCDGLSGKEQWYRLLKQDPPIAYNNILAWDILYRFEQVVCHKMKEGHTMSLLHLVTGDLLGLLR